MGKQARPVAIILTADWLAEKYIFKDGVRLSIDECVEIMATQAEISDGQRAYRYLQDVYATNPERFNPEPDDGRPSWGYEWTDMDTDKNGTVTIKGTYICMTRLILENILQEKGFKLSQLMAWVRSHGLTALDDDEQSRVMRIPYKLPSKRGTARVIPIDLTDGLRIAEATTKKEEKKEENAPGYEPTIMDVMQKALTGQYEQRGFGEFRDGFVKIPEGHPGVEFEEEFPTQ